MKLSFFESRSRKKKFMLAGKKTSINGKKTNPNKINEKEKIPE